MSPAILVVTLYTAFAHFAKSCNSIYLESNHPSRCPCSGASALNVSASTDSVTKKQKHTPADAPTAYDVSDSQELPSWVTERVRICQRIPPQPRSDAPSEQPLQDPPDQPQQAQPEFVMYWMRTALRGHENPALDVAKHEAKQKGLPLLVVAFVLTAHPYPTARRFKFWLEGLRDTQRELRAQAGVPEMLLSLLCHELYFAHRQISLNGQLVTSLVVLQAGNCCSCCCCTTHNSLAKQQYVC